MNYGLYLSASGVFTNLHRQDVHANNLANVSTVGFKRSMASMMHRDAEVIEDRLDPSVSKELLNQLGGGVLLQPSRFDTSEGPLRETHNDFDLAIQGDGYFTIQVFTADGAAQRLSRDGRFTLADDGRLVTINGGHGLLDESGRPIVIDRSAGKTSIDGAGRIRQNGSEIGRIELVRPRDPQALKLLGHGQYAVPDDDVARHTLAADGQLNQGFLEDSNVEPIRELLQLIAATKAISGNGNMIRYHDLMMDRAVNVLGRVA
ncbi:MAG: hypothetical protein CMJ49_01145 [Planctomycetaceae bacterium]|nr:hypothetical protein [Planctomycetaceae bacterium]